MWKNAQPRRVKLKEQQQKKAMCSICISECHVQIYCHQQGENPDQESPVYEGSVDNLGVMPVSSRTSIQGDAGSFTKQNTQFFPLSNPPFNGGGAERIKWSQPQTAF